jgi:hypothetical protein
MSASRIGTSDAACEHVGIARRWSRNGMLRPPHPVGAVRNGDFVQADPAKVPPTRDAAVAECPAQTPGTRCRRRQSRWRTSATWLRHRLMPRGGSPPGDSATIQCRAGATGTRCRPRQPRVGGSAGRCSRYHMRWSERLRRPPLMSGTPTGCEPLGSLSFQGAPRTATPWLSCGILRRTSGCLEFNCAESCLTSPIGNFYTTRLFEWHRPDSDHRAHQIDVLNLRTRRVLQG